ncbi:MAG TPA: hypothetical protein DDX85_04375 [Nitrospiraceae bacterium]|nr:hypothetical protein [Nitrospiraceae bacterium]
MKKIFSISSMIILLIYSVVLVPDYSTAEKSSLKQLLQYAEKTGNNQTAIYDLDVMDYFKLSQYDTELKKNTFKKTPEYQEKLNKLKSIRQKMLENYYYIELERSLGEYDINRKGFEISFGGNIAIFDFDLNAPKSAQGFIFPSLPIKNTPDDFIERLGLKGIYEERLFLPMGEEQGLSIETHSKDTHVYLIFKMASAKDVSYEGYIIDSRSWVKAEERLLMATPVRVIVGNDKSNEVYFDKEYK